MRGQNSGSFVGALIRMSRYEGQSFVGAGNASGLQGMSRTRRLGFFGLVSQRSSGSFP